MTGSKENQLTLPTTKAYGDGGRGNRAGRVRTNTESPPERIHTHFSIPEGYDKKQCFALIHPFDAKTASETNNQIEDMEN